MPRFNKFLLYFGYSAAAARDVKVGVFCKTLSDFALEYRTTRDRVVHQRQKKATQRQRNMTRGKMIVEVSRAMCRVVGFMWLMLAVGVEVVWQLCAVQT